MRQRLGKTWATYAEFKNLEEQGLVDWFILICPNSLKEQWQENIEHVDPYTPICIYDSQHKSKSDYYFKKNKTGGVFIINYESLDSFLKNEGWDKLILLEHTLSQMKALK